MYLLTVSFIQKMEADVDGMMQVRSCAISNVHLLSLSTPISLYHLCFKYILTELNVDPEKLQPGGTTSANDAADL